MKYIEQLLEKLRELGQKLIEVLFGPEAEPETEAIPIPVDDRQRCRYH
ncbi:hypothetical protein [Myxosarcina sp. GI1(2024)]